MNVIIESRYTKMADVDDEVGEDVTEDVAPRENKVFVSTASQTGNEVTWKLMLKEGSHLVVSFLSIGILTAIIWLAFTK
jgi:hypothetical protein